MHECSDKDLPFSGAFSLEELRLRELKQNPEKAEEMEEALLKIRLGNDPGDISLVKSHEQLR